MIILNTLNHENNKIEYHFSHDDFKGVVFKILSNFDIKQEGEEYFMTCEYDELEHNFNGITLSNEEIKRSCDQFSMAVLQSLYDAVSKNVEFGGAENAG